MRDPDSLAQVMGEILGEPAQLEQMRLASRAWVEANFEKELCMGGATRFPLRSARARGKLPVIGTGLHVKFGSRQSRNV